jgi:hypothetical protein
MLSNPLPDWKTVKSIILRLAPSLDKSQATVDTSMPYYVLLDIFLKKNDSRPFRQAQKGQRQRLRPRE